MPPKTVNYIELFSKLLEEFGNSSIRNRDKEHEYYFRGHSEKIDEILPKIYRKNEERKIVNTLLFLNKGVPAKSGKSMVILEKE